MQIINFTTWLQFLDTIMVNFNYFPGLQYGNVIDDDCCGSVVFLSLRYTVSWCCICMIDTFYARSVAMLVGIELNAPLIFFDLK